jgi:integrase
VKLDAKTVAALTLPAGRSDVIYFDATMPGFGYRLRLGSGGKVLQSWVVQYKRAGATRRLLLGSSVLGVEAARTAAKKALAKVELGGDPQGDKAKQRAQATNSLKAAVADYLEAKRPLTAEEAQRRRAGTRDRKRVRPRTIIELVRYLQGPAFKPLHGMALDQITRRDVAARLSRIDAESGPVAAKRARGSLSAFYTWAMSQGLTEVNPVIGTVAPEGGEARERTLTDDELTAVWRACKDDGYGRIVKLLILLGARRQEVGGIVWSELDLDKAMWTLPAARSKNGRAHTLPLMPMAMEIIRSVPRMASRAQLFGERGATGFTGWAACKNRLDARSGTADWTIHDIRRTVATRMADIGIAPHVIEAILNHYSGHRAGPAGVYNRSNYPREVRAALALWEDHIRMLVEGTGRKVLAFTPQAT